MHIRVRVDAEQISESTGSRRQCPWSGTMGGMTRNYSRSAALSPGDCQRAEVAGKAKTMAPVVGALLILSGFAWHGHVTAVDRSLTSDLVQRAGSTGFRIGEAVSTVGSGGVVALVALVLAAFVWRRSRDLVRALTIPFSGAVAGVAELVGKEVVGRLRPVTAAATRESGFGFPSGHTTGFTAMAVAAVLVLTATGLVGAGRSRTTWLIAVILTLVVGFGRVVVGAHYVFDILAGLALGVLCAQAAVLIANWLGPIVLVRLQRTPLGRMLR